MPLQATSGAASYDAFGGGVAAVPNYIEDVFSTYLYTGNQTARSITNGIDLSTKGGMVWIKDRTAAYSNGLFDTARGVQKRISSNSTSATQTTTDELSAFNVDGFSIGNNADQTNATGDNYVSWTFRKQPKFFDVVTYTGNGASGRVISHSLGSNPGCIIIKRTNTTGNWATWHRSLTSLNYGLYLNTTDSEMFQGWFSNVDGTSFTISGSSDVNGSGSTYVAYIYAHNAGGFGLTGTDNVISCGSTTMGAGITTTTLGYEPQWLLIKGSNNANAWWLVDNMRGLSQTGYNRLIPNDSTAETAITSPYISITSTGFTMDGSVFGSGNTFIYIAIRRGPMKVPTSGTSVFSPNTTSNDFTASTTGFPVDAFIEAIRAGYSLNSFMGSRLQGGSTSSGMLFTSSTNAETTGYYSANGVFANNTGVAPSIVGGGTNVVQWNFRRAPSFFDEVCYTGTADGATQISHNLAATPELVICKSRSSAVNWSIACNIGSMNYVRGLGSAFGFNSTNSATQTVDFTGVISSTYFKPQTIFGASNDANQSGVTYVAYLFATCAGVSKVGSYTGTGTTQQINCGFTAGARFVMVKRTDSTGDWYVWDTARGMVSGTDPSLLLNSTAAEVNVNSIYTTTGGFQIVSTASGINASGGTYIYLAIA